VLQLDEIGDYLKAYDARIDAMLAAPVVKINVGCGINLVEGYINVDIQAEEEGVVPDLVADAKAIPLPDGCADEVMAIHLFEHLALWECEGVLIEWRRLLKHRGMLVLELPDIIKCCRNVVDGIKSDKDPDQLGLLGIYGDVARRDPYMLHKWGWSPKTLGALLEANGFVDVRKEKTQFHVVGRRLRDMRLEARKA
jgi:hypothetical protein